MCDMVDVVFLMLCSNMYYSTRFASFCFKTHSSDVLLFDFIS